jgi:hypothetical protein
MSTHAASFFDLGWKSNAAEFCFRAVSVSAFCVSRFFFNERRLKSREILWCLVSISAFFRNGVWYQEHAKAEQAQPVNMPIDAFVSVAAAIHAAVTCGSEGLVLTSAAGGSGNRHDTGEPQQYIGKDNFRFKP